MPRSEYKCPFMSNYISDGKTIAASNLEEAPCMGERCKLNIKTGKDTNNCSLKIVAAGFMALNANLVKLISLLVPSKPDEEQTQEIEKT